MAKKRRPGPRVTIPDYIARRLERAHNKLVDEGREDHVEFEMWGLLNGAGIDAGLIDAVIRSRRVVTHQMYMEMPPEAQAEWDQLVAAARERARSVKSVPLPPEAMGILKDADEAFKAKFGREQRPNDPVFFDPSADSPQPINAEVMEQVMSEAMHRAGADPALIYAHQKTGLIVTRDNVKYLSPADRQEWEDAVTEGQRLYPDWKR
jgi:hypothetical protein